MQITPIQAIIELSRESYKPSQEQAIRRPKAAVAVSAPTSTSVSLSPEALARLAAEQ